MNIKSRIEKLEDEYRKEGGEELIVYVANFGHLVKPKHGNPVPDTMITPLDPEKEIARQRAEGKKLIVVEVPYGYEVREGEKQA